ncbi:MAG: nuclear transport factor 2 family protein [Terriglobia bacterium]|nr:nuclear transport factor 2 family protein [Terriglobia bacterium]
MPKTVTALEIKQIIRNIAQEYAKHMNARNVDQVVAFYAVDGRVLAPFKPMVQGHKAIRQLVEEMFKEADPRNLSIETQNVEVAENLAFSDGIYSMIATLPTGKRMDYRGTWVTTLRREGPADWKIVSHIYNTDLPMTDFLKK